MTYDEVEILGGGIKYDRPSKGSFALNLIRRYGAWEVRKGFGQLTQFDTRITHNISGADTEWGYREHLGSHAIRTDSGHTQIVSVFKSRVYTSEVDGFRAMIADVYTVSIYDATTRERWEEPLYRHTSESGLTPDDMESRNGHYETCAEFDYQAWIHAAGSTPFSFVEVRDTLFFGSPTTELYAYSPCTFRGNRRKFVAGAHGDGWKPPYSESSMVWRVRPSPGAFTDEYRYRGPSGVPSPLALTAWDGRLVVAGNEREVFFSQKDRPTSFIDGDVILVPTEKTITAMAPIGQSIYIFTETETWVYQPASGSGEALVSMGMEPVRISESIGCVSQSCITSRDGVAIWLSHQGVHASSGGLDIETVSGDIAPLFTDFITDPSSSFFANTAAEAGSINLNVPQRNSVIRLDTTGASVQYSELLGAVLVTLPSEAVSLCLSGDEWSVWTYESNTATPGPTHPPDVGAVCLIKSPWLVAIGMRLFLVGSTDVQAFTDEALFHGDPASPVDDDTTSRSAYILEYGRGGAIDRSVDDEDYRTFAGKYVWDFPPLMGPLRNTLILGEWIPVEQQYRFNGTLVPPAAASESAPAAPGRCVLVPIYLVPSDTYDADPITDAIAGLEIQFQFDNTRWRPVFTDVLLSTDIDMPIPSERIGSADGWTTVKCELGGVPDRAGDTIHLVWDGAASTGHYAPILSVLPNRKNLLCYIPMMTISDSASVSGMGIARLGTQWCDITSNGGPAVSHSDALIWREWRVAGPNGYRMEDDVAQPVDWAYMSADVGLPENSRVRARGVCVRLLSHGQGDDVTGGWEQGVFNTMMAADLKTWMAQVIDFVGSPSVFTKPVSIQSNLLPTASTKDTIRPRSEMANGVLLNVEFSNGVGGTLMYGDPAVHTHEAKTCLIGDEQVDEIITSDNVAGHSIATMLFGFMRNPAETLKFESVKLLYRLTGRGRRRRGR